MIDPLHVRRGTLRRAPVALAVLAAIVLALSPASAASEDSKTLFAQGFELYKSEIYRGAIALFQQGLASDPNNGLAHFYLAECHYKLGELAPALEHYRTATALLPDGEEATRARNLAVAIEAELGATTGATEPAPAASGTASTETAEPSAQAASGPVDWGALTADTHALARAITEFYDSTQPVAEVKGSTIINVFSIELVGASGDRATVKFRCEVRASHGKTGIFRAHVNLAAASGTYSVTEFKQDERFDIVKGFAY
jgi:tetratricopeptide (TPR) repeat protein